MRLKRTLILPLVTLLAGALLLSACGSSSDRLEVQEPWARSTAPTQTTGAIYASIRGGSETDRLLSASVPTGVAGTTEIHETVEEDDRADSDHHDGPAGDGDGHGHGEGAGHADHEAHGHDHGNMSMRPVKDVPVPAGETVNLEPGGIHIMLMDLKRPLKAGEAVPLTLSFAKAGEIKVDATVRDE